MDVQWLYKKKSPSLIIFCNGWGMDVQPFVPLQSKEYDVLVCSNYTDDKNIPKLSRLIKEYSQILLLSWSYGVFFGQYYFEKHKTCFDRKIAINGTLCPVDDYLGIPRDIFDATLQNLSDESIQSFYKRMCRSSNVLDMFEKYSPERTLADQILELQVIKDTIFAIDETNSMYTDIIISKKDFIIPTANQYNYWKTSDVTTISGYHFPFYGWKTWDEIIECCN